MCVMCRLGLIKCWSKGDVYIGDCGFRIGDSQILEFGL